MNENVFQSQLIRELKDRFAGCIVMKADANYIQGLPDLLILYRDKWAALECKRSHKAKLRPNQDYYISQMDEMSFAAIIYPENKEDVLNELQRAFET